MCVTRLRRQQVRNDTPNSFARLLTYLIQSMLCDMCWTMMIRRRRNGIFTTRQSGMLDKCSIISQKVRQCCYFSSAQHTCTEVSFDSGSNFTAEQTQLVFAEYLIRWAIPPVKLADKLMFYSTIVRQFRCAALAACKMLRNNWPYSLPREIS